MKKFIKLERILTEQQLSQIIQEMKSKTPIHWWGVLLRKYRIRYCVDCTNVGSVVAIYQPEDGGASVREIYCQDCIDKKKHLEEGSINNSNFNDYFIPMTEEIRRKERLETEERLREETGSTPMYYRRFRNKDADAQLTQQCED